MLKTKKLLGAGLAAVVGLSLVACHLDASIKTGGDDKGKETPEDKGSEKTTDDSGVDFVGDPKNPLITVKNETAQKMVLFEGYPSANQILGGADAYAAITLKLPDNFVASNKNGKDFVVYTVTYDNYLAKKDNVKDLDTVVYSSFYAVYNKGVKNETTYKITSIQNGTNKIVLQNGSKYNVEVRNNGTEGESLLFSKAGSYNVSYYLSDDVLDDDGQALLFPVFRKFDSSSGEIFDVFPTYQKGTLQGEPKSIKVGFDDEQKAHQFNAKDWAKNIVFNPSAAYIDIVNSADQGLNFFDSATGLPVASSSGKKVVNAGKTVRFSIAMEKTGNGTYTKDKTLAGLRLGQDRITDIYLLGDAKTPITLKSGYLYTFTVTGDPEEGYTVTPAYDEVGSTVTVVVQEASVDEEGQPVAAITEEQTVTEKVIRAEPVDWSNLQ